jgi:formate dehydrogenase major subunit
VIAGATNKAGEDRGKALFMKHCSVCHPDGSNIIDVKKDLSPQDREANKVKTEVFLLPACSYIEREGSLSDSARTAQWRYKAIEPIGESKADGQIIHEIYMKLKTLYEKDKGTFPDPILKLKWDYAKAAKVDTHLVAKDINGYFLEDVPEHPVDKKAYKKGTLVPSFVFLLDVHIMW